MLFELGTILYTNLAFYLVSKPSLSIFDPMYWLFIVTCHVISQVSGRLLPCGALDDWIHVNCALWSAEVYEDYPGLLYSVHTAVCRGLRLVSKPFTSHCRKSTKLQYLCVLQQLDTYLLW